MPPMEIEATIVSIGYGDFLRETLPHNLAQLDHVSVVTCPEDRLTQDVCRRWNVKCLLSNVHKRDAESPFNKSRAINHGLNHLKKRDWLLHIDSDIVLPIRFRQILANAELKKNCIYGADRVNCPSWEEWQRYQK